MITPIVGFVIFACCCLFVAAAWLSTCAIATEVASASNKIEGLRDDLATARRMARDDHVRACGWHEEIAGRLASIDAKVEPPMKMEDMEAVFRRLVEVEKERERREHQESWASATRRTVVSKVGDVCVDDGKGEFDDVVLALSKFAPVVERDDVTGCAVFEGGLQVALFGPSKAIEVAIPIGDRKYATAVLGGGDRRSPKATSSSNVVKF